MTVTPDTPLTQFPGVGEVRAKKLSHLGLNTAGDLLTYYPRDYEDRRQVYTIRRAPAEEKVCIQGMIPEYPRLSHIRKGLDLVQVPVVDQGGTLHLTFFNQSYVERALLTPERKNNQYVFTPSCMEDMEKILKYKSFRFSLEEIELLFFLEKTTKFRDETVLGIFSRLLKQNQAELE